jgi:hypothetical protein
MNDSSNWSPGPLFAVGRGFDDVASLLDWVHQAEADHSDLAPAQFDDAGLVAELQVAAGQRAAAEARWLGLLAEAEKRHATTTVTDLPTSSWLAASGTHSARSARAEVAFSVELDHWPAVAEALADGRVSPEQARVIVHGLQRLPADLDAGQAVAVADQLVGFADRFGPAGLARLVNRAVEVVAPETADDFDRRAVERADAAQQRDRYAHLSRDLDGSWLLRAKLPTIPGTLLAGILRSMSARHRVAATVAGETLTAGQATADALASLADHASSCGTPPRHGTDRPRILVAVDLDVLRGQLGTATLLNTAEPITAHHARQLASTATSSAPPSSDATKAAPSRGVTGHRPSVKPTTANPGGPAATPASPTASSSAHTTTTSSNPTPTDPTTRTGPSNSTPEDTPPSPHPPATPTPHATGDNTTATARPDDDWATEA